MFYQNFDGIIDADFEPALNELCAKATWYNKSKWTEIICAWTARLNVEYRNKKLAEKKHSEIVRMFILLNSYNNKEISKLLRNADNFDNIELRRQLLSLNNC